MWIELLRGCLCNKRFRLLDMFMSKEELPVEIAEIDGVKVDDVDLTKACKDEVLEELAANATGAD